MLPEEVRHITDRTKKTDMRMSMTFEIILCKDGDFSNIYANSSLTGYRL